MHVMEKIALIMSHARKSFANAWRKRDTARSEMVRRGGSWGAFAAGVVAAPAVACVGDSFGAVFVAGATD